MFGEGIYYLTHFKYTSTWELKLVLDTTVKYTWGKGRGGGRGGAGNVLSVCLSVCQLQPSCPCQLFEQLFILQGFDNIFSQSGGFTLILLFTSKQIISNSILNKVFLQKVSLSSLSLSLSYSLTLSFTGYFTTILPHTLLPPLIFQFVDFHNGSTHRNVHSQNEGDKGHNWCETSTSQNVHLAKRPPHNTSTWQNVHLAKRPPHKTSSLMDNAAMRSK